MEEWLKEQLARGFPDFAGTTVTGSIPVREELINQLIARYLAQGGTPTPSRLPANLGQLTRFVRSATVHTEPGVVTLRFEIGV